MARGMGMGSEAGFAGQLARPFEYERWSSTGQLPHNNAPFTLSVYDGPPQKALFRNPNDDIAVPLSDYVSPTLLVVDQQTGAATPLYASHNGFYRNLLQEPPHINVQISAPKCEPDSPEQQAVAPVVSQQEHVHVAPTPTSPSNVARNIEPDTQAKIKKRAKNSIRARKTKRVRYASPLVANKSGDEGGEGDGGEGEGDEESLILVIPTQSFYIGDEVSLAHFLTMKLAELRMNAARKIVTSWIKLAEPNRRADYGPYHHMLPTEQPGTAPRWWPRTVRFTEPSHQKEEGNYMLGAAILMLHRYSDSKGKRRVNWVSRLQEDAEYVMKFSPAGKLYTGRKEEYNEQHKERSQKEILPEIFKVARFYEEHVAAYELFDDRPSDDPEAKRGTYYTWSLPSKPPTRATGKERVSGRKSPPASDSHRWDNSGSCTEEDDTLYVTSKDIPKTKAPLADKPTDAHREKSQRPTSSSSMPRKKPRRANRTTADRPVIPQGHVPHHDPPPSVSYSEFLTPSPFHTSGSFTSPTASFASTIPPYMEHAMNGLYLDHSRQISSGVMHPFAMMQSPDTVMSPNGLPMGQYYFFPADDICPKYPGSQTSLPTTMSYCPSMVDTKLLPYGIAADGTQLPARLDNMPAHSFSSNVDGQTARFIPQCGEHNGLPQ